MTQWLEEAKDLPPIKPLIAPWWNEGETCFFFGSTGLGKTIYAMQLAYEISKDKKVLYFDFEMTERQLLQRYQNNGKLIPFSENLIRVEMKKDVFVSGKKLTDEIASIIKEQEAKVVIIDNLTWLLEDTQEAKNAIPFMKNISKIKREHDVSMLIIAHTPKRKPTSELAKSGELTTFDSPLELADMAGSAALNNFIDSCFAIGKSRKDDLRYFKQLKSRSSEIVHGEEKVVLCRLGRTDDGFLGFSKEEEGSEYEHIFKGDNKKDRNKQVSKLKKAGLSSRQIGEEMNMSHTQIQRIIKEELAKIDDTKAKSSKLKSNETGERKSFLRQIKK